MHTYETGCPRRAGDTLNFVPMKRARPGYNLFPSDSSTRPTGSGAPSDFSQAIKYHTQHLEIAKEVGDRAGEGKAYANLGNAHFSLGDYSKAIE